MKTNNTRHLSANPMSRSTLRTIWNNSEQFWVSTSSTPQKNSRPKIIKQKMSTDTRNATVFYLTRG